LLNFIENYLDNATLTTEFLNVTYQGLKSYDEARIMKKMFLSKNMDSANEIETAYNMFGKPCTQEEASLMTYKPLTCPDGQVGGATAGYCYSKCDNTSYASPGVNFAILQAVFALVDLR
jgi:hypothetical protein